MKLRLVGALLFAVLSSFGVTLIDVDFTSDLRRIDIDKDGTFHGVLPKGVNENFTGWSEGHATSELKEEDGRRFLRLTTRPGVAGGQFQTGDFRPPFPGFFRLRVTARVSSPGVLSMGLRLMGSPYTSYSSSVVQSTAWREEDFVFEVREKPTANVGLYLYTGAGTADLAHVTLETATEADLTAAIPRPPKTVTDYIRHPRFPLGLPTGWNLGRDTREVVCSADREHPAADGMPVLKLATPHRWELWGEAFQTAYPGEAHTLAFRYQAEQPFKAVVLDDKGHWMANRQFPASADWRDARLVFQAGARSEGFGLRFAGEKGVFRLDEVHVFHGEGDRPAPQYPCQAVLAVQDGEIADETRIQFADEPFRVRYCALGSKAGDKLRVKMVDLYGRERDLGAFNLKVGDKKGFQSFTAADFKSAVGQFRFTAWVERAGRRVSADEELVVTRLARPVAWGRDAPDSPFGSHFNPTRATTLTMKAGGVNWVRLHDAGSWVSGWYAVEREKGKWNFFDDEVATYRDAHVKIFAQLGTAPAWATHFGDLGYKHMGYFEKYLRPTNAVDWVNYVTRYVDHHRNNIDEYFIWNEPWGQWWRHAADAKWYEHDRAGFDFAAFSRLTYDAVKKVDPKIRVSGFNTTGGAVGRGWSTETLAGGAFDCCDIIDWHFYTPHLRGRRGEGVVSGPALDPIRAVHPDFGGKPVYMSEGQGGSTGASNTACHMSGLYQASVPWACEAGEVSLQNADQTVRYILSLLAEGNAKVYLYSSHCWEGLAKRPGIVTLLQADGFAHPALVAHAQLARAVEGKRFVRREDAGVAGVAYVFSDGTREVRAYSDLTKEEILALKGAVDLYGNPVTPATVLPGTVVYAIISP